jgi:glycosyltransferase involved in cell wall biosynthesis
VKDKKMPLEDLERIDPLRVVTDRTEPTVTVIIPAKNEALNLPHVFAGLEHDRYEVILIDGGSTDDTVAVARQLWPEIIVIGQTRKGKGNALACGFRVATGDFIVTIDADGSTDPSEIPHFIEALKQGADFATGSRFIKGAGSSDLTQIRRIGSYLLSKFGNLLYGTRYTDPNYGYNAFRRECLSVIDLDGHEVEGADENTMLWGDGFEVETLIHVRIANAGLKVTEVPCFERSRYFGSSNLNAFSDGIRVFRTIHAERRRGVRNVTPSSASYQKDVGASWSVVSNLAEEAS